MPHTDRPGRRPAPLDPEAHRQLLLTRIAFERDQLRRDVASVREASTLSQIVRSAFGVRLNPKWLNAATGAGAPGAEGWIGVALAWLRRYRLAASVLGTLFGGAAPLLQRRGRWRRLATMAAAGAAAYWAWSRLQPGRRNGDDGTG